jgi:Zn-dependent peptidase ImmA (M78 family)/predicted secreted protein
MSNRRDAVLGGTLEAARLLKQIKAREIIEQHGGRVDVFAVIVQLGVPLLFKPLDGLLGAYIPKPSPGILVTTERQLSIQRYTAAHELGHLFMGHQGSLDDETIVRRSPFDGRDYDQNELAANTFAAMFLMPDWLFNFHAHRQQWSSESLTSPTTVYQMSLRVGTSYEATCRALERHGFLDAPLSEKLLNVQPRDIKKRLLENYEPPTWRPNVWVLTERDSGTVIFGEPEDLFIVQLREHSGAGYLWNLDQVKEAGFNVVSDQRVMPSPENDIGGAVERILTAQSQQACRGTMDFVEVRPWDPDDAMTRMSYSYEFEREHGMARTARQKALVV